MGAWALFPVLAAGFVVLLAYAAPGVLADASLRQHSVAPFTASSTGTITTVAGTGVPGDGGDGGPATNGQLAFPYGLALGPDGSLYIADSNNHRVRKVSPGGIITTVAGTGAFGFSGDGRLASTAQLSFPTAVAIDPDGSLYIADWGNERIRKVSASGIITTVAGTGTRGFSRNGAPAISAQLGGPGALALGPDGSLYIAEDYNNCVRRVTPTGIITAAAGVCTPGIDTGSFAGDGEPAANASLNKPGDVALGPDSSLYIADRGNQRIRKVRPDGIITTVAGSGWTGDCFPTVPAFPYCPIGDGGPATSATLRAPHGVAVGPDGSLYIADQVNHRIRQVTAAGIITTVAGSGPSLPSGLGGYGGDGGPATQAQFNNPLSPVLGPDGSLYIADSGNHRIRRVTWAGPPARLAFTAQPIRAAHGYAFGRQPQVAVQDAQSITVAADSSTVVTLAIRAGTGTAGAALACEQSSGGGTAMVVSAGVAAFSGCRIDQPGVGYQLEATAAGLTPTVSAPFNVTWAGDTNGDCRVSATDYSAIVTHFAKTGSSPDWRDATAQPWRADLTGDERVSVTDYSIVVTRFGTQTASCPLPSGP